MMMKSRKDNKIFFLIRIDISNQFCKKNGVLALCSIPALSCKL